MLVNRNILEEFSFPPPPTTRENVEAPGLRHYLRLRCVWCDQVDLNL
jgi:hypothetical protein